MRQSSETNDDEGTENIANPDRRDDDTQKSSSTRGRDESLLVVPTSGASNLESDAADEVETSSTINVATDTPSQDVSSSEQASVGPTTTAENGLVANDAKAPRVTLVHESDGTQHASQLPTHGDGEDSIASDGGQSSSSREAVNTSSSLSADKDGKFSPSSPGESPTRKCEDPDGVEPSKKHSRLFTDSFLNILDAAKSEDESDLAPVFEAPSPEGSSSSATNLRRKSEQLIAALAMEPPNNAPQEEKKSIDPMSPPREVPRTALSILSEATESTTSSTIDPSTIPAPPTTAAASTRFGNSDIQADLETIGPTNAMLYPMESDISVASVQSVSARLTADELARSGHMLTGNVPIQQHPLFVVPRGHPSAGPGSASPYPGYAMQPIPTAFQPMHPPASVMMSNGGKRRIQLRLVEESIQADRRSLFSSFRRTGRKSFSFPYKHDENEVTRSTAMGMKGIDRGQMSVSWYEGTTSIELQEHVRNSVIRKLGLNDNVKLDDFRILDDTVDPAEGESQNLANQILYFHAALADLVLSSEIVLCPFIPDGSKFLLRFSTKTGDGDITPFDTFEGRYKQRMLTSGPPDSPSAAPSPLPSSTDLNGLGLNANQLALLGTRLKGLQVPNSNDNDPQPKHKKRIERKSVLAAQSTTSPGRAQDEAAQNGNAVESFDTYGQLRDNDLRKVDDDAQSKASEMASLHPEDPIEARLRQITELLIAERAPRHHTPRRKEKRQVIFVLANYFVLFLALIAISAEIQARAPGWHASLERHLKNVQSCATDQDALFDCVSNGDFAGLVASVVLWISRSAATRRIFLFGFESTQKLWTVVYESLVTAVCWGFSYMFIRRGMNPDTSRNFLYKYWKDAVYGSLAGFNAAFMKQVLKNLIPQEAIEDALQDRQLKILSWLPSFTH